MSDNANNGVNDEEFDDTELSAMYRETRIEQPSPQMDQAVLAMAKQHARKKSHPASPFSARWPITASMVAILVLGVGLVTLMRQELGSEQATQVSAPEKIAGGAKKKTELKRDELSQQSDSAAPLAPAESELAGAPALPGAKPAAPNVVPRSALRTVPKAVIQEEKAAPAPEPSMGFSDRATPQHKAENKMLQAERQSESAARLKAPEAAIAMKRKPSPAPLASEAKTFRGSVQGVMSEEAIQPLQKSQSAGSACGAMLPAISAQDYWRAYISGNARIAETGRTTACVMIESQGEQIYKQITLAALQDRAIKLKVFKTLLNETMKALAVKKLTTAVQQQYMGKLQRLTGLNLTTLAQWQSWYQSNHAMLVLSVDGKYLVRQSHD